MKKIAKTRNPKGFFFEIKKFYRPILCSDLKFLDEVEIRLKRKIDNRKIGSVSLIAYYPDDNRNKDIWYFETHSYLNHGYRGKGLGAKIYCRAIQWALENGYKIRSSPYSSDDALRVWKGKSIRKKFRIRKRFLNDYKDEAFYCAYAK